MGNYIYIALPFVSCFSFSEFTSYLCCWHCFSPACFNWSCVFLMLQSSCPCCSSESAPESALLQSALWHSPLDFRVLHLFWHAVLLQPLSDEFWSLRCIDLQTFPLQYSFSWWQSMKHMITQQPKLFKEIECVWLVLNFCFLSGLSVEQVTMMLVSNSFKRHKQLQYNPCFTSFATYIHLELFFFWSLLCLITVFLSYVYSVAPLWNNFVGETPL